jgi:hypothetical protein
VRISDIKIHSSQPTEKKLMVENCQAEMESEDFTKTNDANLDLVKATVDIDKGLFIHSTAIIWLSISSI